MNLYELDSSVESRLADKADRLKLPLGGTMELTPLCNMNCKMCYIRQNPEEMKKQGRMLTCDEWLRIAKEAREAGVLYLMLTGGEPLVYPEFRRLYTTLSDMGFIITINTNGTLIDEEWADFFAERPCRRMNITLYGENNEAYERLCHSASGFSRLMRALDLLDDRRIPYRLNYTVTPDNVKQLEFACEIAKRRGVPIEPAPYLFPPVRIENEHFERLTPKQVAQVKLSRILYSYGLERLYSDSRGRLLNLKNIKYIGDDGLACRAGSSGFWMSWTGDILACGMIPNPKVSLLEYSFADAWKTIVEETAKLRIYSGCRTCDKRMICSVCAAGCLAESGDMTKRPDYICEMTEEYYRLLNEVVTAYEQKME